MDTLYIIDSSEEDEYILEEMYAGLLVMMESWEIAAARGSREERGRLLMLVQDQLSKIGVSSPMLNLTPTPVAGRVGGQTYPVVTSSMPQMDYSMVSGGGVRSAALMGYSTPPATVGGAGL